MAATWAAVRDLSELIADKPLMADWMVAAELPCFDEPWHPEQNWLYWAQV